MKTNTSWLRKLEPSFRTRSSEPRYEESKREAENRLQEWLPSPDRDGWIAECFRGRLFTTELAHRQIEPIRQAQAALPHERKEEIAETVELRSTPTGSSLNLSDWFDPRKWAPATLSGDSERSFFLGIAAFFIHAQEEGLRKALGDRWPEELCALSRRDDSGASKQKPLRPPHQEKTRSPSLN